MTYPIQRNMKKTTIRHDIIKLTKISDKEKKILKEAGVREKTCYIQSNKDMDDSYIFKLRKEKKKST